MPRRRSDEGFDEQQLKLVMAESMATARSERSARRQAAAPAAVGHPRLLKQLAHPPPELRGEEQPASRHTVVGGFARPARDTAHSCPAECTDTDCRNREGLMGTQIQGATDNIGVLAQDTVVGSQGGGGAPSARAEGQGGAAASRSAPSSPVDEPPGASEAATAAAVAQGNVSAAARRHVVQRDLFCKLHDPFIVREGEHVGDLAVRWETHEVFAELGLQLGWGDINVHRTNREEKRVNKKERGILLDGVFYFKANVVKQVRVAANKKARAEGLEEGECPLYIDMFRDGFNEDGRARCRSMDAQGQVRHYCSTEPFELQLTEDGELQSVRKLDAKTIEADQARRAEEEQHWVEEAREEQPRKLDIPCGCSLCGSANSENKDFGPLLPFVDAAGATFHAHYNCIYMCPAIMRFRDLSAHLQRKHKRCNQNGFIAIPDLRRFSKAKPPVAEIKRCRRQKCALCQHKGAQLGCHNQKCDKYYHFSCANSDRTVAISTGRINPDTKKWFQGEGEGDTYGPCHLSECPPGVSTDPHPIRLPEEGEPQEMQDDDDSNESDGGDDGGDDESDDDDESDNESDDDDDDDTLLAQLRIKLKQVGPRAGSLPQVPTQPRPVTNTAAATNEPAPTMKTSKNASKLEATGLEYYCCVRRTAVRTAPAQGFKKVATLRSTTKIDEHEYQTVLKAVDMMRISSEPGSANKRKLLVALVAPDGTVGQPLGWVSDIAKDSRRLLEPIDDEAMAKAMAQQPVQTQSSDCVSDDMAAPKRRKQKQKRQKRKRWKFAHEEPGGVNAPNHAGTLFSYSEKSNARSTTKGHKRRKETGQDRHSEDEEDSNDEGFVVSDATVIYEGDNGEDILEPPKAAASAAADASVGGSDIRKKHRKKKARDEVTTLYKHGDPHYCLPENRCKPGSASECPCCKANYGCCRFHILPCPHNLGLNYGGTVKREMEENFADNLPEDDMNLDSEEDDLCEPTVQSDDDHHESHTAEAAVVAAAPARAPSERQRRGNREKEAQIAEIRRRAQAGRDQRRLEEHGLML